jgi:Na+/H+ antiporter NhaD/arsenite permease-like protein
MILPFALWLGLIALAPLCFSQWWTRHYGKLALLFAAATTGYYLFVLPADASQTVLRTAHDYFSFIVLIGSLYVVSGGIHIELQWEGTPWRNVCFLALGGLAANVLGTTGASMLLIRPWLRLNESRPAAHHVVFFIFIVANIGGGLTPIGDPPLLLGFLKGVPFWWVLRHCWPAWLLSMGLLLGAFYVMDRRHYARAPQPAPGESGRRLRCDGLWNLVFLSVIVAAVFIPRPWFLREGLMLAAAAGSFLTTGKKIHEANQFSFEPMFEVAVLFFGIFATLMPVLDWLYGNASIILGSEPSPSLVYWSSGGLSSVLDSAPAYLAFFSALSGLSLEQSGIARQLAALSIATVFFGAVTYVGNGPNLMIKAIAERQGIRLPTFPGYVFKWAVPILLPLLLIVWMIFVRQP